MDLNNFEMIVRPAVCTYTCTARFDYYTNTEI